jgi:hypothetical protein
MSLTISMRIAVRGSATGAVEVELLGEWANAEVLRTGELGEWVRESGEETVGIGTRYIS